MVCESSRNFRKPEYSVYQTNVELSQISRAILRKLTRDLNQREFGITRKGLMPGKLSRTLSQTKAVSLLWALEVTQRLASMGARQIAFYNQLKLKMNIVLRFLYTIY
ncbi:conserved hypothetical protein [Leptospira interrogans serovar Manilae]|uniref:Uncharacterized protein n=2 Tax=Leptospira interrogans TaxID=173 RepID=A0AAQ1NZI8_LEPIR|nr:hypothetical protein LIMLP_04690 [Leptospira interrogans serovar Manilae]AKP29097.1 hypothetical protein LIMHP_04675 [Leptospira interrogans serovar Manilae]EYU62436.1 hypothetical protein CI00_20650 [Leptospira interrogans serovar Manilae]SOR62810.1 conserved hypothetical protein [Leptospira interrogans serovar Manilae]